MMRGVDHQAHVYVASDSDVGWFTDFVPILGVVCFFYLATPRVAINEPHTGSATTESSFIEKELEEGLT